MKNLYVIFICLIMSLYTYAQQYVTWTPVTDGNQIVGTFNGGTDTVTGTFAGPGIAVRTDSSPVFLSPNNLVVNGANIFSTFGPLNQGASMALTYSFSTPVIVTQYNMADIDRSPGNWDDSFNFDIAFTTSTSTDCIATNTGVTATMDSGVNTEIASWFCSGPITNFSLNYIGDGNATHAYLGYSMEVFAIPTVDPICLNQQAPTLAQIFPGINGTLNPANIDTSIIGVTTYTFTPTAGQALQCPVPINITVIDDGSCCQMNAVLASPNEDVNNLSPFVNPGNALAVRRIERSNLITATNLIGFGDNTFQNGVVYHAENCVVLDPGFEAVFGSQFSAYPEGCSGNYLYRLSEQDEKETKGDNFVLNQLSKKSIIFKIIIDKYGDFIDIPKVNLEASKAEIFSISGRLLYSGNFQNLNSNKIDISSFDSGVYITVLSSSSGHTFTEKFIKN